MSWSGSSQKDCLCATVHSLNKATKAAVVTCNVVDEPRLTGETLAYLSPYWQAYHIWMVLDPEWGWKKKQFREADALAQNYQTEQATIVDAAKCECGQKWNPPMEDEARVVTILLVTKVYLRVPSNGQLREAGATNTASYTRAILKPANSDAAKLDV